MMIESHQTCSETDGGHRCSRTSTETESKNLVNPQSLTVWRYCAIMFIKTLLCIYKTKDNYFKHHHDTRTNYL